LTLELRGDLADDVDRLGLQGPQMAELVVAGLECRRHRTVALITAILVKLAKFISIATMDPGVRPELGRV